MEQKQQRRPHQLLNNKWYTRDFSAKRSRVSAGTGWPGVAVLRLEESPSSIDVEQGGPASSVSLWQHRL